MSELWLFRCKAKSSVEWNGTQMPACKVAASLRFRAVRQFEHSKGTALLKFKWVTIIVLTLHEN